jgi:hypothetical protein
MFENVKVENWNRAEMGPSAVESSNPVQMPSNELNRVDIPVAQGILEVVDASFDDT